MVYGKYNYSFHGNYFMVYKPTYNWGGAHPVDTDHITSDPEWELETCLFNPFHPVSIQFHILESYLSLVTHWN